MKTVTDKRTVMVKKPKKVYTITVRKQLVMRPNYKLVKKTELVKTMAMRPMTK